MPGSVLTGTEPNLPVGLYGKLPAKGDFILRRLPRGFVEPWDMWLQQGMERSRDQLGDDWLAAYLRAPLWRFALAPGVCGEHGAAGVVMSSVDAVGRYFPLTLAALLPSDARPAQVFSTSAAWFASAELLLLEVLDQPFDFANFDQRLCQLSSPRCPGERPGFQAQRGRLISMPSGVCNDFAVFGSVLVDSVLAAFCPRYSLWWTVGSEVAAANCMICQGLPRADDFAGLLTAGAKLSAEPAFPRHREGES